MTFTAWLEACEEGGDFVMDVDGYYVYCPKEDIGVVYNAAALRALADHLDSKNKIQDDRITEYFRK